MNDTMYFYKYYVADYTSKMKQNNLIIYFTNNYYI